MLNWHKMPKWKSYCVTDKLPVIESIKHDESQASVSCDNGGASVNYLCYLFQHINTHYVHIYSQTTYNAVQAFGSQRPYYMGAALFM